MNSEKFFRKYGIAVLLILSSTAASSAVAEDGRSENAPYLLAHSYTTQNGPQTFSCFHKEKCETKEVEYIIGTGENGLPIFERKTVSECSPEPGHTCVPIN